MHHIGVDGCRGGWLVAASSEGLAHISFKIFPVFSQVLRYREELAANCIVDIPIGLEKSLPRSCDLEARRLLGPKRQSSVFPAPCRATLEARTFEEACKLNREACDKAVTQQLFAILPKIREVDEVITSSLQELVREAHPEVSFALVSGRMEGLSHGKKSAQGRQERMDIVRYTLGRAFDPVSVKAQLGSSASLDDVLDATICLVTAHRVAHGRATVLPRGQRRSDSRGLHMEMVA